MNKVGKGARNKIAISIVVVIITLFILMLKLLFWNCSYVIPQVKVSPSLVDKVRNSQKNGIILELNQEELNEVISMYFKKESTKGNITIKGINADILNNNLKLSIPIKYKNINVLMFSEGELFYENNKIKYKPLYFKAGKIDLPKTLILNKAKSYMKQGVSVEDGIIVIDKSMIPLDIKSLQIKDNKVLIGIQKASSTIEEKVKSIENKIKESTISSNKSKNSSENLKSSDSKENVSGNKGSKEAAANNNSTKTTKDMSKVNASLDRVSGGLSASMSSVSTGGQKAVISQMISAVNSMKGNPSADPYAEAGSVRSTYNSLSPQEKAELKAAVFSNVDGSDINILSEMLGK